MSVYVSNISIDCGADFAQTFILEESITDSGFNLSNYNAKSQLKKHPQSLNVTAEFDIEFFDRVNGIIVLTMSSEITSTLKPGRYIYDILIYDNNIVKKVVEGSALVNAGVTKIDV